MAEWHDWLAWYRNCALAACDPRTRDALQSFALTRWRRYVFAYAGMTNCDATAMPIPSADIVWHDFETLLRLRHTRRGKAYKQWLFARQSSDRGDEASLKTIEGGATLIMRDVVRERLRREWPRRGTVSLNAPPPGAAAESPTLQDWLPASDHTLDDVQQRDLAALGEATARHLCREGLSRRAKTALLAREEGLSIAHPAVLQAAGCGKSSLYAAYADALETIAASVNRRFRQEDRATRAALAVATLKALIPHLRSWAKLENFMTGFF